MKALLTILLFCFSEICVAQCNSILIEHKTGGGGGGHMNFWIVDNESSDTTLYDKFVEKHNDGRIPGCTFFAMSQPRSFNKLIRLSSKMRSGGDNSNTIGWGTFEITRYDANDNVVSRHYLCCGEITLEKVKKLSRKRSVKKYVEISDLFQMMIFSLDATKQQT